MIWLCIPLATWGLTSYLCPYSILIRQLTRDAFSIGNRLRDQQASHFELVSNQAPRQVRVPVRICVTVVSPNIATFEFFCFRSHCQHLHLPTDDIRSLHMLSKCCQGWCSCAHVYFGLHNFGNLKFGSPIHQISLAGVVGCVHPSLLC